MRKYAKYAGADQNTPSVPQYFSWINNTNEGATESHTLTNLEFFRWLREEFGMEIKIYAWDAGNFDGADMTFGSTDSPRFKKNYPNEYKVVAEKAAEMGIRFGLWGSPDGFGETEEEAKARADFFIHLCRDYKFALFKLDGVCGPLREEKVEIFSEMLRQCRKYSPDLIILNHRLNMYSAEKYITTFLWNGDETYTDVAICNKITAMHNRAYMFSRGHVPGLRRLCEDHGVCISSAIDYFEDELCYQAFNRSLILAPEMYGNPWLMRDGEFPRLARVYNLQKHNAQLLTKGIQLPDKYGCNACSRGTKTKRYLSTGNDTWETKQITIDFSEIGIETNEALHVNIRHPFEKHIGIFNSMDSVTIDLLPFRATLIEVSVESECDPYITGCTYEVVHETEAGVPDKIKALEKEGDCRLFVKGAVSDFDAGAELGMEKAPILLATLDSLNRWPANGEELYESCMFSICNDSLEKRSLSRAGETKYPAVKAARDAFFNQETYRLRGCEAANMFDGNPNTFFDAQSKTYCGEPPLRIDGGCLRVDLGNVVCADAIEIECFATDTPTPEVMAQQIPSIMEYSENLSSWKCSDLAQISVIEDSFTVPVVRFRIHDIYNLQGKKLKITYPVTGSLRYLRIAEPMDRIYAVRAVKNGVEIPLTNPTGNNMQSVFARRITKAQKYATVTLPDYKPGSRLAVAINGYHGVEGVYCGMETDGKICGADRRAPDFKANIWEHRVMDTDSNNTFFFDLPDGLRGKEVKIFALFSNWGFEECDCKVYLCDAH